MTLASRESANCIAHAHRLRNSTESSRMVQSVRMRRLSLFALSGRARGWLTRAYFTSELTERGLIDAPARVQPEWLEQEKVRADQAMLASLGGTPR